MSKEEKIDYMIRAKEKKFTKKNGTTIKKRKSFFLQNLNLYTCRKKNEPFLNLFLTDSA